MRAIAEACVSGAIKAEVALVLSSSDESPALEAARSLGLATAAHKDLLEPLQQVKPDLVCLAGYMRLIPPEVLAALPRRILNIHPALLPRFGGQGMYGLKVHEAVLAAGEAVTGCTVHFVDEQYDHGAVILQRTCPVLPGDTPETLAARVLAEEHRAYPEAIAKVLHAL